MQERLESEDDNQQMMLLLETYLARQGRPCRGEAILAASLRQSIVKRTNLWPFNDRHSYQLIGRTAGIRGSPVTGTPSGIR